MILNEQIALIKLFVMTLLFAICLLEFSHVNLGSVPSLKRFFASRVTAQRMILKERRLEDIKRWFASQK